jgi:hypothetical protein
MSALRFIGIPAFLLLLEAAVPAWRDAAPVSRAPVFFLPMAAEAMNRPGGFRHVVEAYQADRGAELKLPGPDRTSLTLFYFEWDQVQAGPMMDIIGHTPEHCNTAAGFTLKSLDPDRIFETPDHDPLVFDASTFTDPAGRGVHVFKAAWMQGHGSRSIREGEHRRLRLRNSFIRGRGAARVIECGVTGAADQAHAWRIFQQQVLQGLVWQSP